MYVYIYIYIHIYIYHYILFFDVLVVIHYKLANFNSVLGYMCHRKSWHYFERQRN